MAAEATLAVSFDEIDVLILAQIDARRIGAPSIGVGAMQVDWTDRYPAIADAAAKLRARSFTLDGEAVVCGPDGVAVFDALHRRGRASDAILQAFDLLELDGVKTRDWPQRLTGPSPLLRLGQFRLEHAPSLFQGFRLFFLFRRVRTPLRCSRVSYMCGCEVGAARIGDGRNAHPPLLRRQAGHAFEPLDPGHPERLGIGHDVGLGHRHDR
jgi:hypothetical protein